MPSVKHGPDGNNQSLAKRIKAIRENRGLTLTQLAKRSSISKSYLSQLENGHADRPSAEYIVRIVAALGCSIEAVLGRCDSDPRLVDGTVTVPTALRTLAMEDNLSAGNALMLAQISYEGHQPSSVQGWRSIWQAIRDAAGTREQENG